MYEKITEFLENSEVPIIALYVFAGVVVVFIVAIIFEILRHSRKVSDEEAYFNSMMYEDEDASKFSRFLNTHKRYYLRPFENKSDKNGFYIVNSKDKVIYEGYETHSGFTFKEYTFENHISNRPATNKIGKITKNSFGVNTFIFNNEDIWEHLKALGITFKTTVINDTVTLYSVDLGNGNNVFAKRIPYNDNEFQYRILTKDKNIDTVFLIFFAFELCQNKD